MSVWNKLLIGCLAAAALVFLHAAVRTVKTFYYWSDLSDRIVKKIDTTQQEIVDLRTADREHPLPDKSVGTEQLHFELGRLLANRGRIWTKCEKKSVQMAKDGREEIAVSSEDGFSDKFDKKLLYVFEEGDEQSPGNYLGEYAVKAVSDKDVVLSSTTQPTTLQQKFVQDSKTPWVCYEKVPADQHELFVTMSDDKKKTWFPEDDPKKKFTFFAEEYLKDGQTIGGELFERKLRDYLAFYRVCEVERTLFVDRNNALDRDDAYLKAANADAEAQLTFAQRERTQADEEHKWEYKQRDATAAHYEALKTMLGLNQAAVKAAIAANAELAQRIAKLQKDAADQIDRRTRDMARIGAGAN